MRKISSRGCDGARPTAIRLTVWAADKYRFNRVGERSVTVTLSKPRLDSSGGKSDATSTSSPRRSRIAFLYSVRLSRRNVSVRPGFGCAEAAVSSDDANHAIAASYSFSRGRGMLLGGI